MSMVKVEADKDRLVRDPQALAKTPSGDQRLGIGYQACNKSSRRGGGRVDQRGQGHRQGGGGTAGGQVGGPLIRRSNTSR
jgi:hypothetical protein